MEVNKLESREVMIILFGVPLMVTVIVLSSICVGHWVTTRSEQPTNINVASAPPKVDVHVPSQPAPNVSVTAVPSKVDVNVPNLPPPTVNVTAPPAVVTLVEKVENAKSEPKAAPAVIKTNAPQPQQQKTQKSTEEKEKSSQSKAPESSPLVPVVAATPVSARLNPLDDDEVTMEELYEHAEKYIEAYCRKNGLDPAAEAQRWSGRWRQGLEQAMADNIDTSEQSYINRVVISKRSYFDVENSTPEKIVEACRIMLRYRDGGFAWLSAMKEAMTGDNMKKARVFLAAGPK